MGVGIHGGTMPGAVTPMCDCCGVALCWDISEEEYEQAKAFWDAWICQDCNGGESLSLKHWMRSNALVQASGAPTINEGQGGCSASPATES